MAETFLFAPGVVVDSAKEKAYVMSRAGGMACVDLTGGIELWESSSAAKPLLLVDDLLVAQVDLGEERGRLRLAGLDTGQDGKVAFHADVPLPKGVLASIDDRATSTFRLRAWSLQDDTLVHWRYTARPWGGLPESSKSVTGSARVNLVSGTVLLQNAEAPPDDPLPDDLAKLRDSSGLAIWRSGAVFAAVARLSDGPGERAELRRWSKSAVPLEVVPLYAQPMVFRYASADGRHLLGSGRTDPGTFLWRVHSSETGTLVAELEHSIPGARFFLSDGLLIHEARPAGRLVDGEWTETPLALRAVDFESGAERWRYPYRDRRGAGAAPPARR